MCEAGGAGERTLSPAAAGTGGVDGSRAGGRAGGRAVGGAWRSSVFWRRAVPSMMAATLATCVPSMAMVGQLVRGLATGCTDQSGDGIWPGGGRGGGGGGKRRRARHRGMTPPHITPAWAAPHYSATTSCPSRQREKRVMISPCAGSPPCLLPVIKGVSTSGHGSLIHIRPKRPAYRAAPFVPLFSPACRRQPCVFPKRCTEEERSERGPPENMRKAHTRLLCPPSWYKSHDRRTT